MAYWEVNLALCLHRDGWREKQRNIPMSRIIPWIDDLIAGGDLVVPEKPPGSREGNA